MKTVPAMRPEHDASLFDRMESAFAHFMFRRSPATKVRLSGGKPVQLDGNTLHPDMQLTLFMRKLAARGEDGVVRKGTAEARQLNRRESLLYQGPEIVVGGVFDLILPGTQIKARHFAPAPASNGPDKKPLLVFFHGGGFVLGDLDTHDAPCRFLCKHADVHVLSIEYRLSPEAPFPTAADEAIEAFRAAAKHAEELGADPKRIGVAGDSAGGNLSAVVAQQTRSGRAPDFAVLIYPAVDRSRAYRSQELFGDGFLLTRDDIAFFDQQYFGSDPQARRDPRLSPLLHEDLRGLCPSVVITAGFDPLRDEGAAYAEALEQAGNVVTLRCERELIHGFINMTGTSAACSDALMRIAEDTRRLSRA
jgi:acetyl esterase